MEDPTLKKLLVVVGTGRLLASTLLSAAPTTAMPNLVELKTAAGKIPTTEPAYYYGRRYCHGGYYGRWTLGLLLSSPSSVSHAAILLRRASLSL
jgi:hypothetical protein